MTGWVDLGIYLSLITLGGLLTLGSIAIDDRKRSKQQEGRMNPKWEAAANAKGGKHRHRVEQMHAHLKSLKTPEERKNAAIDMSCLQLQAMKTDGSTVEDIIASVQFFMDNRDPLLDMVAHGDQE